MAVYWIDITLLLFIGYGIVMTMAALAWKKMQRFTIRSAVDDSVSIIIAARNEEKYISRCLASLLEQDYPLDKREIIVVDDQSDDRTADMVNSFSNRGVKLLQIKAGEKGGKKAALSKGIAAAQHGIIVATDADCVFPPSWLKSLVGFRKEQDAAFVAAPVVYRKENNFLERFQSLDFMALQSITAVAVTRNWFNMCNGANLLYTKEAFEKVKGFEGIDGIPTGDDMLLMEKIAAAYPGKVAYCHSKEALVQTEPMNSWQSFLQQRIRWASKSTAYQSLSIKLVLLIVYLLKPIPFGASVGSDFLSDPVFLGIVFIHRKVFTGMHAHAPCFNFLWEGSTDALVWDRPTFACCLYSCGRHAGMGAAV